MKSHLLQQTALAQVFWDIVCPAPSHKLIAFEIQAAYVPCGCSTDTWM